MMYSPLATAVAILGLEATNSAPAVARQRSDGCGKPLPEHVSPGISKNLTIESNSGVSPREYRIHLPESYDVNTSVPLILSFHGRGKDMLEQEGLSQFSNASYGFKGIAIYPQGIPNAKGTRQWQGDPDAPSHIDDVTFTMELLDHISDRYCVDTTRIYAAGKSNGGGFTGLLACDAKATERIAAFAPVSGAFYLDKATQKLPPCTPTKSRKTIPIMDFHGWRDKTIEYLGGPNDRNDGNTTNVFDYVKDWAKRDGLDVDNPEVGSLCNGTVKSYKWADTVIHYNETQLFHDWPSSFPNDDTDKFLVCPEAEGTRLILDWFPKWCL